MAVTMAMRSEQLAKASKDLMLKEPFYGLFLIMLNKQWNNTAVPTAGVSRNGINYQLYLNEMFWDSLTEPQRRGLLKHEVLHIGFFHIMDYNHLPDQEALAIALDMEINQYITEADLPPGAQLPENYPELNLELKKGSHYYYDKVVEGRKKGNCPNLNNMLAAMGNGQGSCNMPIPGKGDVDVQSPDHGSWGEFDQLTEAEQKLVQVQTEHLIKEVAEQVVKSRGTVPGEFKEILERIKEVPPPKFDWRGYLRRFTGGSEKTFTKKTRRKFNKRYEGNPGLKIKPKRHILVALDTSGSVSTKEIKEFMIEIHHMHKTGSEITMIQCDTAIRHKDKYDPRKDYTIFGRGGTSFDPVLEYYNENTRNYTCLIYLTDGGAPAPVAARGKMLWVMSTSAPKNEELIGPQIKLN